MDDKLSIINEGGEAVRLRVGSEERKQCIETILDGSERSSEPVVLKARVRGLLEQLAGVKLDSTMIGVTVMLQPDGRFQVGFAESNAYRAAEERHFGLTALISEAGEIEDCAWHSGKLQGAGFVGGTRLLPPEHPAWGVVTEVIDTAIQDAREVGDRSR